MSHAISDSINLDLTEHDHLAISVNIPDGVTRSAETRDGALLDVSVTNTLPCVSRPLV